MLPSLVCAVALASLAAGAKPKHGPVVFEADLTELYSSGVSGSILLGVFDGKGLIGKVYLEGLTPGLLKKRDCISADRACMLRVTSGSTCEEPGDDYYGPGGWPSPWRKVQFPYTGSDGTAYFEFSIASKATSIGGKLVVVYDEAGKKVACGTVRALEGQRTAAYLPSLSDSGVFGLVHIVSTEDGRVAGFGAADGLEPNLRSKYFGGTDCTATNGCGVHVHNGTGCEDADAQGAHFWLPTSAPDPWLPVIYKATSYEGFGVYIFDVAAGTPDVAGRPFIVHNNAGGRVACGVLRLPCAHDDLVSMGDDDVLTAGAWPLS